MKPMEVRGKTSSNTPVKVVITLITFVCNGKKTWYDWELRQILKRNNLEGYENFLRPLYASEGCFFRFCRDSMPYIDKARGAYRQQSNDRGHDGFHPKITSHRAFWSWESFRVQLLLSTFHKQDMIQTMHDIRKIIKKHLFTNKRFWLEDHFGTQAAYRQMGKAFLKVKNACMHLGNTLRFLING